MIPSPLDAALFYAARGWHVFPVWWIEDGKCACPESKCEHPGKHPLGTLAHAGRNSATIDEKIIRRWWKAKPKANIGIATGRESNLVVLDIDPRNEGDKSLKKMPGNIPMTTTARTGGSGWHYFFKYPANCEIKSRSKTGGFSGVDQKGDGGYVIVPPSNHLSGELYSWDIYPDSTASPIVFPPQWLLELLTADTAPSHDKISSSVKLSAEDMLPPEKDWALDLLGGVAEGERDNVCSRLAGKFLGLGMPEEAVEALLLLWNVQKNIPPLPDKDIRKVVKSIARAEGRKKLVKSVPETEKGEGEEIPDNLPEEEKRAILIESLGKRLGIPLESIARMGGEQVKYIFRVNENGTQQAVWMTVPELTSWNHFKNKIATLCRRMIPAIKSAAWSIIVQRMMDAAMDEEPGPEGGIMGRLEGMLQKYLENYHPHNNPNGEGDPFFLENDLNIILTSFSTYVSRYCDEKISNNELAQRLRSLGLLPKERKIEGKKWRYWIVPQHFLQESPSLAERMSKYKQGVERNSCPELDG